MKDAFARRTGNGKVKGTQLMLTQQILEDKTRGKKKKEKKWHLNETRTLLMR